LPALKKQVIKWMKKSKLAVFEEVRRKPIRILRLSIALLNSASVGWLSNSGMTGNVSVASKAC